MWVVVLLTIKAQFCVAQFAAQIDTTPSKILLMFPSTQPVVVHYENSTSYIVNTLFTSGFNGIIYFINHDVFRDFLRPSAESVLNAVVLSNHNLFLRYSLRDYNIEQEDVVFFIEESATKPNGMKPLWDDVKETLTWTNSLVYIIERAQLYYCCYCCGKKSGVLQKIVTPDVPYLVKTFRICYDFNGALFKIAYISYEPFFWCL